MYRVTASPRRARPTRTQLLIALRRRAVATGGARVHPPEQFDLSNRSRGLARRSANFTWLHPFGSTRSCSRHRGCDATAILGRASDGARTNEIAPTLVFRAGAM